MIKAAISTFCIVISTFALVAQQTYTTEEGNLHFLGPVTFAQIEKADSMTWFAEGYEAFETRPDKLLKKSFKDVTVKVFIGTWCGDTKSLLPQFAKAWESSGLKVDQLDITALHNEGDQYKRSPGATERAYGIHRVPTFVFERNGKEIGRIVERPMTDLHTDMKQIAMGLPTNPRYRAVSIMQTYFDERDPEAYMKDINAPYRMTYREVSKSGELNTYGYVLKAAGEMEKAEAVFFLNTYLFRKDPNTHDSLGELYLDLGRKEDAKKHYARVLELEPGNEHAKEMMEKME